MTTTTTYGMGLLAHHATMLNASAVSPEVAAERGYVSVTEKTMLARYGFSRAQQIVPGLLIPTYNVRGVVAGYQYRPDHPRALNGRTIKYESPAGTVGMVNAHPRIIDKLRDPAQALWITEGAKKADAAISVGILCVALPGVWSWRGTNAEGGKTALACWDSVALNDRDVVLAFDSDAATNPNVYDALVRLHGFLTARGAKVRYCTLPDGPDGSKVGMDDFIVAHDRTVLASMLARHIVDRLGERPRKALEVPVAADGFRFTEVGNSDRLIARHGERLRYVPTWGRWLAWDGCRWAQDHRDVQVTELAKDVSRGLWELVETMEKGGERDTHIRWAQSSESAHVVANTIKLARGVPGVPIDHIELDADPMLLNVINGTIDLSTGILFKHDPERLCTLMAGTWFDPNAAAPRWETFLERVLPDPDLRNFVQRAVGYSLTGDVGAQIMFLLISEGANGKSTFVDAVTAMLGEYAGTAAKDLLITQKHEAHPTSMADLFRVRFAAAMETEATNTFAEAKVKALTGGDAIKARRMREDFWTFTPTHKLWLSSNYLPKITGTDTAIWRRIRVVPFNVTIPTDERDPTLPAALRDELPGILAWAVRGCLAWQAEGIEPPQSVIDATAAYRAESDWFSAWCEDSNLVLDSDERILTGELASSYRDWCSTNGEIPINRNAFAKELRARGCRDASNGSARVWLGIGRKGATL